ncbi:hypothetical protein FDB94_18170 [Clostridium botulinum]|nr:hypothetical protein [Clostridium botulinum]
MFNKINSTYCIKILFFHYILYIFIIRFSKNYKFYNFFIAIYKQSSWLQREFLLPLNLRKWLSRDVTALYSHFEEDESIRAGSHRINKKLNYGNSSLKNLNELDEIYSMSFL